MEYFPSSPLLYELYRFQALVKDNDLENPSSEIYSRLSDGQTHELSSLCSDLHECIELILEYRRSFDSPEEFDSRSRMFLGNAYDFLHGKLLFINGCMNSSTINGAIPSHGYDETKRDITDADALLKKLAVEISSQGNMSSSAPQHCQGDQNGAAVEQADKFEMDGARILEDMRGQVLLARAEMQGVADSALRKITDKAGSVFEKIKKESDDIKKESDNINKESYVIMENIKVAAGYAGVLAADEYFRKQEEICRDRRETWGEWTFTFFCVIIVFLSFFYSEPASPVGIYQNLGLRIATLAVLISAAAWCGKIYKALYHQEMINNHKALCLKTMWAFANATKNKDDRDTIVIQASKAVFGSVPTGFVQERSSDSDFNIFTAANQIGRHGNQTQ